MNDNSNDRNDPGNAINPTANGGRGSTDSTDEQTRLRQEAHVLSEFMTVMQRRVEELRMTMGSSFDLTDGEKKVLQNLHTSGMMEGTIAGLATFVLLRRGPKAYARYLTRRLQQQQHQQHHHPGAPGGIIHQSPFQQQTAAGGEAAATGEAPSTAGRIFRVFQFGLDVIVSLTVAAYVSWWQMDRDKIMRIVTEIPLMEGRSALSDAFCSDLIKEYQRQWNFDPEAAARASLATTTNSSSSSNGLEEQDESLSSPRKLASMTSRANGKPPLSPYDRKDILLHPQIKLLEGYVLFTRNCQRRQTLEQHIRQEQGLAKGQSVSIPFPGVVVDNQSSLWMEEESSDSSSCGEGGYFYDSSNNGDNDGRGNWDEPDPSAFVTDQEDSQKKR